MSTSTALFRINSERLDAESYVVWVYITTEYSIAENPDGDMEVTLRCEHGKTAAAIITVYENGTKAFLVFPGQDLEMQLDRVESDDPLEMAFIAIVKDKKPTVH